MPVLKTFLGRFKMKRFITFEGIEGSGKTTQIRLAENWLRRRGQDVLATAEPGGTPLGRKIREILLNRGSANIGAEAELLLFAAARAQHVAETIVPALEDGKWVLCDRYTDATTAYQGFGRRLNAELIQIINDFSTGKIEPELTFLFDLPVEIGLKRALKRAANNIPERAEDRFEQEETDFHQAVRDGYLQLAKENPGRFRVINAAGLPEDIHHEVCRFLDLLPGIPLQKDDPAY
jgi:dTMP kinase